MKQKNAFQSYIVIIVSMCAALALVAFLTELVMNRAYHRKHYGQVKDGNLKIETPYYNLNLPENLADQIYVETGKSQEKILYRGYLPESGSHRNLEKNYRLDLYYEDGETHIPVATLELYGYLQDAYSNWIDRWLDMGCFRFWWKDSMLKNYSYLIFCWDDSMELTQEQTQKVQDLRAQIQKAAENIEVRDGEDKVKDLETLSYEPLTPPQRDGMSWTQYRKDQDRKAQERAKAEAAKKKAEEEAKKKEEEEARKRASLYRGSTSSSKKKYSHYDDYYADDPESFYEDNADDYDSYEEAMDDWLDMYGNDDW